MSWKRRSKGLRDLAEGLVKAGALQFGTTTLPSGKDSSYFIDLRGIASYPGVYRLLVDAVTEVLQKKAGKANAICGIPTTGLLIAAPASVTLNKPLLYTKAAPKASERVVEGEVRPGWKVVVIDDVSTSGRSILGSAKAVEQEGGEVTSAVVLIDRMAGAREKLSKQGISLHAVTDVVELADTLASMELITEENLKAIARSVGTR